ncbi:MAG TPA: FAD-binding protein, partial [Saprospiraceae bacterium]|nr:FAD-binding protein [Saprospiraceae bacterium]
EIVVNGMSLSRRDSPFANSGLVTAVDARDFVAFKSFGPLAGMYFQKQVEQKMFSLGDGSQKAPAQRLKDFIGRKLSTDLPESSYIPGILPASLHQQLPPEICDRLIKGLMQFVDRMPLYGHAEAIVVATESRTSAPVKIPRDRETLMHPKCAGLFPAGEGAGFAGGILSAAMDGQRVAQAVHRLVTDS